MPSVVTVDVAGGPMGGLPGSEPSWQAIWTGPSAVMSA